MALRLDVAYGRLVVSGDGAGAVASLPGATRNAHRGWWELSLTTETLRAVRRALACSQQTMRNACSPVLLRWAMAAAKTEKQTTALHAQLAAGWRLPFPWVDGSGEGRRPFAHQEVMAAVAATLDGCAFVCEMGTAKTRPAVEVQRHKIEAGFLDLHLVVCPKNVMPTWERQIARWAAGSPLRVELLDGKVTARAERLERLTEADRGLVLVLNYDVLADLLPALGRLAQRLRVGVVFDEMHRLKNPNAQVTRAAMKLVTVMAWRVGMTGTPMLNGLQDIWSQWYLVDYGVTFGANFVQYRREFLVDDPYTMKLRPRDDEALHEVGMRMRKRGLRYTKAECLDLPPKLYETLSVEMTPVQRKAYRDMAEELLAVIEEAERDGGGAVTTATTELVKNLRLSQITSGFVVEADTQRVVPFERNPKLDAVEELVAENVAQQQVIVWARYRQDVAQLMARLQPYGAVVVQGGQSVAERRAAEEAFQSGRARVLVANPGAGGEGMDLWQASLAVYYSQSYHLGHRLQSEDRCHRAGSERHEKVTYVDVVCRGTVDEIIAAALAGKKGMAEVVVDLREHLAAVAS
jgi:SNF2 family DNA or RNA helicase